MTTLYPRLRIGVAIAFGHCDKALKVNQHAPRLARLRRRGRGAGDLPTAQHGGIGIRLARGRVNHLAVAGELGADGILGKDDLGLPGGLAIGKHATLVAGRRHGTEAGTADKVAYDGDRPTVAVCPDAGALYGADESRGPRSVDHAGRPALLAGDGGLTLLALKLGT